MRRRSQRASRAATTGCPGPVSSPTAHVRPVIAISMASAGPETSGPEPWLQSRSEVVRCTPRAMRHAGNSRRRTLESRTGRSRSAGIVRGRPSGRRMSWWWMVTSSRASRPPKVVARPCGRRWATQPVEELVGTQLRKFVDACLVDVGDSTADGTTEHLQWTDSVEAHDVSDYVTDTPALAQRRGLPLLGVSVARRPARSVRPAVAISRASTAYLLSWKGGRAACRKPEISVQRGMHEGDVARLRYVGVSTAPETDPLATRGFQGLSQHL